jgi:SNF2 family DNA or RNA helicase
MLTTDLYPYQDEAVDLVLDLGYGLIAYEMGLGKTIVGIAVAEELLAEPAINFAMIVVPSGLKYQWAESIAKFTDVKTTQKKIKHESITIPTEEFCVVVDGPPKKRKEQYRFIRDAWPNYVILSYEQVAGDWRTVRNLQADLVIADEATYIKGFKAARSKKTKALDPEFAVALTGTPIENRPEEAYSIMEFVCPEYLGDFEGFDIKYIERNGYGGVKKYKNLDILHRKLGKVMSRKTRLDPDVAPYMPKVAQREEYVDLSPKVQKLYRRIAKEVTADLAELKQSGDFDIHAYYTGTDDNNMSEVGKIQAKVMAMQMLCDHPELLKISAQKYEDSNGEDGSAYAYKLLSTGALEGLGGSKKMEAVLEDARSILDSHPENKIIIFSFFKDMGYMIQEALEEYDSVIYNGNMGPSDKAAAKARFQQNEDCRLFIASDAGAFGVDLPQANYLFNYDLVESAGKMDQRNARHVRAGSKHKKVFVVNYLVAGSIEERTFKRLNFKRKVSRAVIDGQHDGWEKGVIENDVDSLSEFLEMMDA